MKFYNSVKANFFGRLLLRFLTCFYWPATAARNALYKNHILKSEKAEGARVVCIGNITTGGTGKTTGVIKAAELLSEKGIKTAVVSRGYKRSAPKEQLTILSQNNAAPWQEAGDEPYMMFNELQPYNVPVLVCSDRIKAAKEAVAGFASQIILMDDGYQHHKLVRDANIVLIDAKNPFGEKHLLPLGSLREPLSALKRASLALITHSDLVPEEKIYQIKETINKYAPGLEIIKSKHKPKGYINVASQKTLPLSALEGKAIAVSAIGEPQSFEDTLTSLGLKLEQVWRFPDHHPYTEQELSTLVKFSQNYPIITTRKDFTKFPPNWRDIINSNLYILTITLDISKEDLPKFEKVLLGDVKPLTKKEQKEIEKQLQNKTVEEAAQTAGATGGNAKPDKEQQETPKQPEPRKADIKTDKENKISEENSNADSAAEEIDVSDKNAKETEPQAKQPKQPAKKTRAKKQTAKKTPPKKKAQNKPSIEQRTVKTVLNKILNNLNKQQDLFGQQF